MDEAQLVALVEAEFDSAMGAPDGDISTERAKAWSYYLSKLFGNEIEGQSQVVTSDVADVVDSIMPSLLRIFTTADNLIDFKPTGAEDVPKARQESDYVRHVFFEQNPAFLILYTWFFDALVQKNGIVKAWWDESEEVTTENYAGLSEDQLAELMDDDELEPVEQDSYDGEVAVEIEPGVTMMQEATLYDVSFKRRTRRGRACVEPVPPEEYRISADSRSVDPCGARMVGQESEKTRSELLAMEFDEDVIDALPAHGDVEESSEEIARRDHSDEDLDTPHDRSQDKILVKEAYIRADYDGDGHAELRQVFAAGGRLLSNEEIDRQPFHVICPQPLPHKHFGRATAEKVMDTQLVNSTLRRQVLDNLYHTNNPSHAVWEMGIGENTLDDLLTTRVGGIKRFARPVDQSWKPIEIPFTAGATFPYFDLLEKEKRDRTGIVADGEGLSPEALKNIQISVLTDAMDLSRMKVEMVARIFAETGIKSLFGHLHEIVLKHQKREDVVDLRNQWVAVKPSEWRSRKNMKVRVGLGVGTRRENLLHLDAIWQKQVEMVEKGGLGLTVSLRNLYNTASEIVLNTNKTPEQFFTDPGDAQPQQDNGQAEAAQAQLALANKQLELQAAELDVTRERNLMAHEREVEKIRVSQQEMVNSFTVAMENVATKLTELELKFAENVPGAKV